MLNMINSYRYEEKRWVPRDGKPKSPSRQEEKVSMHWPRPSERISHGYTGSSERLSEERKNIQPPTRKDNIPAARVSVPVPPRGPEQVSFTDSYAISVASFSSCPEGLCAELYVGRRNFYFHLFNVNLKTREDVVDKIISLKKN